MQKRLAFVFTTGFQQVSKWPCPCHLKNLPPTRNKGQGEQAYSTAKATVQTV